jgi:SET domain-containing protein
MADRYLFQMTAKTCIDGNCSANVARFINHACRPNAEAVAGRRINIYARKIIRPEEEIFIDYGREYVDLFLNPCRCPTCRRRS